MIRGRKGEYKKELAELMKKGFQRVKIDGQFYEIAEAPTLDKKYKHDIDVVVDRVVVRSDIASRLADSLETCAEARGRAWRSRNLPTNRCRRRKPRPAVRPTSR
jgi:excinuclease UvrABC ATPase subunit